MLSLFNWFLSLCLDFDNLNQVLINFKKNKVSKLLGSSQHLLYIPKVLEQKMHPDAEIHMCRRRMHANERGQTQMHARRRGHEPTQRRTWTHTDARRRKRTLLDKCTVFSVWADTTARCVQMFKDFQDVLYVSARKIFQAWLKPSEQCGNHWHSMELVVGN